MFSKNDLTNKQNQILEFIAEFQRNQGSAPTYREIASSFGFKSPKAAVDHVRALEKKGFLRIRAKRSRGIELLIEDDNATAISIPLVGSIPAGKPEIQDEYLLGNIVLDEALLRGLKGHQLFALRVSGDSMARRGIYDNDWVVADRDGAPRLGDMVVALIDGENTLKTLARKREKYYLKAENPNRPDWTPLEEMSIQGVARAVLRRI